MGCFGKNNLVKDNQKSYEFADDRIRICQKCEQNFWVTRHLFCKMFLRRAGRTLWPDPGAFIPTRARIADAHCPLPQPKW